MKTKLVPFDIEKAKAGAKVVTRGGYPVRIGFYDVADDSFPILGLLKNENGKETEISYTEDGSPDVFGEKSELDLLIEEEIEEVEEEVEKVEEIDNYDPYKEVVKSISDMVERYAELQSLEDLKDFYDNVKVKCKEAVEYDKKWCKKQEEQKSDDAPKFKVGDKVVLKCDNSLVGSITSVSLEGTYSVKFEDSRTCWYSEQELEPLHKVKKAKSRRMTNQELADWLRKCPEEFREFTFRENTLLKNGWVYFYYDYLESEADKPVKDKLIRRNHGDWEEPLVEI